MPPLQLAICLVGAKLKAAKSALAPTRRPSRSSEPKACAASSITVILRPATSARIGSKLVAGPA
jgi:hypothetical protein